MTYNREQRPGYTLSNVEAAEVAENYVVLLDDFSEGVYPCFYTEFPLNNPNGRLIIMEFLKLVGYGQTEIEQLPRNIECASVLLETSYRMNDSAQTLALVGVRRAEPTPSAAV